MKDNLKDIDAKLAAAVAGSLENMIFAPVSGGKLVWSNLEIKAPLKGALLLAIPWELAQNFTGGVYNQEEEVPPQLVCDCVAEIANTIAGQLLESLMPEKIFSLGLPETGQGTSFPSSEGMRFQHFKIDDNVFFIGLKLE
ncbi:MAG: hypothetical protein A2X49_12420 [Lentisphaerae bacterium GWF2_52_8]|nr:MAG: hypothetical protein A2X49_12420 [Lentisphaerae bacterium GWF2_52_8]